MHVPRRSKHCTTRCEQSQQPLTVGGSALTSAILSAPLRVSALVGSALWFAATTACSVAADSLAAFRIRDVRKSHARLALHAYGWRHASATCKLCLSTSQTGILMLTNVGPAGWALFDGRVGSVGAPLVHAVSLEDPSCKGL
jgi:hypothetical protein